MINKTASWKECYVIYEKVMENGVQKKVKEIYVVDGISFGEAEERIIKEMSCYISGDFEVYNINPAVYKEVVFSENDTADRWYKCRVQFITIDERTEREKRTNVYYLVNADTLEQARKNMDELMHGVMLDYVIVKIEETKIMDVVDLYKYINENH